MCSRNYSQECGALPSTSAPTPMSRCTRQKANASAVVSHQHSAAAASTPSTSPSSSSSSCPCTNVAPSPQCSRYQRAQTGPSASGFSSCPYLASLQRDALRRLSPPRSSSSSSSSEEEAEQSRGGEGDYALYRLSKSAALQAASKGIALTLVAPNSSFPSTPSSHSMTHARVTSQPSTTSAHAAAKAKPTTASSPVPSSKPSSTPSSSSASNSPPSPSSPAASSAGQSASSVTAAAAAAAVGVTEVSVTTTTRVTTKDPTSGKLTGLIVTNTKKATLRSSL